MGTQILKYITMFLHTILIQDRFDGNERECILTILSPFEEVQNTMNQWMNLGNKSFKQMVEILSDYHFNFINSDILETKTIDINTCSLDDCIEIPDGYRLSSFEVGPLYELTETYDDECLNDYEFAWSAKLFSLEFSLE